MYQYITRVKDKREDGKQKKRGGRVEKRGG
jgi:hypothetical protein